MQLFRTKSVEQTIAETGEEGRKLKRNLTWWDLSIMGVAVAVGAGIFSVGAQAAAFHAGPAVIISFLIAGIVCGAAVMCYAEFASMIPVAGSAYTFTYTTVGEIMAWIIGWDLILEMLMAGSVISKYWGVYLNDFMRLMGWNANTNLTFGSFHIDIAPIIIVAFFTTLLVFGTKIGARVDGAMTVLKIAIVFFVVIVGFFYVKASNFTPFIPPSQPASTVEGSSAVTGVMTQPLWQFATGMTPSVYGVPGILSGAALVFFAFIGFDVVATASEETKNPHKNVPLGIGVGMLLIIVMYMLVAVVTTGMVSYADLAKQDSPSLATAFELVGADWAAKIISFGIVLGLATVVMVLVARPDPYRLRREPRWSAAARPVQDRQAWHPGRSADRRRRGGGARGRLLRHRRALRHGQHRHPVRLHAGGHLHPDYAQEAPRPAARLQDARQPVDSDPHRRGQLLVDAQPVRAHLDSFRGVARGRLRHLLRLRLLACAPRQGRPDRNAVRRNR